MAVVTNSVVANRVDTSPIIGVGPKGHVINTAPERGAYCVKDVATNDVVAVLSIREKAILNKFPYVYGAFTELAV